MWIHPRWTLHFHHYCVPPRERARTSACPRQRRARRNARNNSKCVRRAPHPRRSCSTKPVRSGQSIYFPDGDVTVLGSVGSGAGACRGRVNPCLWHVARARDGRLERQRASADLLHQNRGRASCDRWSLPDCRPDGYGLRDRPVQALARRKRAEDQRAGLTYRSPQEAYFNGQSRSCYFRERRRREDHIDRRLGSSAGAARTECRRCRLRRRPAEPRPGDGCGTPRGLRSHQRDAR